MRALMQMTDKEIEDMTVDELKIERMVHTWAAKRWETAIFTLNRRARYEDENETLDLDEIKKQYEDGQIASGDYSRLVRRYYCQERKAKATAMMLMYAKEMMNHEKSISAMLVEQIDILRNKNPERRRGRKSVDMTKVASRNNPKPSWREKHPVMKRLKPLKGHRNYWTEVQERDKSAETAIQRMAPIVTWDYDKLKAAARVAGFYTDELIRVNIARELELSIAATERMLKSGRMSWGQAMLIGALFEMTPALFCDVFLNGYFKEIADGRFVAQVDNKEALRVLGK